MFFFYHSESKNCCLFIIIQKFALQAESETYFQLWFFPRFGGKNGGFLSMRMQVILDSLFARSGSAPIWGGKKVEFRDWTINTLADFILIYDSILMALMQNPQVKLSSSEAQSTDNCRSNLRVSVALPLISSIVR